MIVHDERLTAGEDRTSDLELLALIRQPAWCADALCKEYPNLRWLPERGEPIDEQLTVCRRCMVRLECLRAAVANGDTGVRGGTSGEQRRRLRVSAAEADEQIAEVLEQADQPRVDRWLEVKLRAIALRAEQPAMTYREIAHRIGGSAQVVGRWFRQWER